MLEQKMNGIQLANLKQKTWYKNYFITISQDPGLLENIKKEINKENQVLVMCAAGGRSIIAATLLQMKVILLKYFRWI